MAYKFIFPIFHVPAAIAGPNKANRKGASYENIWVNALVAPMMVNRLNVFAPANPIHNVIILSK